MWKMRRSAFTVIELVVVMIVLGILVTLTLPMFGKTIERAKDKEAIASLKLIQAAERIYQLEVGGYFPNVSTVDNLTAINSNLSLELNAITWSPSISSGYTAVLERTSGSMLRNWTITPDDPEPCCSPEANCPQDKSCS